MYISLSDCSIRFIHMVYDTAVIVGGVVGVEGVSDGKG